MTVPVEVRERAVSEMLAVDAAMNAVPRPWMEMLATDVRVHPATLYRWLQTARAADGADREVVEYPKGLSDEQIAVVYENFGNLAAAKRKLDANFPEIQAMSYATFRRRWMQVDPAIRAGASDGAKGVLSSQLRLLYEADERNQLWRLDHQELPVWVLPAGSTKPEKPWLTTVIDDRTRRVMSVVMTIGRPTSREVVAAVADAVRRKRLANGHLVGGVPAVLQSDNGGELRANHVKQTLTALGITHKRSYPYMSHQNGKVERVQRTMQDSLAKRLLGFSQAPEFKPLGDIYGLDAPLIGEGALVELIVEWVDTYNDRVHSSLDGLSPNQVWCSQSTPLRFPSEDALADAMLMAARTHKVHTTGVRFQNQDYTAPELNPLVGREVEVRFMPHDPSFIVVFCDGKRICTALPHKDLSDAQRLEIVTATRAQYASARQFHVAAAARRRAEAEADPNHTPPADGDGMSDDEMLTLIEAASEGDDV